MSVAFVLDWMRGKAEVNQETIQRLLEENDQLICCIVKYQNKGRAHECVQYQQVLPRKLIFLATTADASPTNTAKKWNNLPVGCCKEQLNTANFP
ncbi:SS18-like protein 2 [Erinaceus europaeus]|uniref:SS18-like protein 2 n=1 Tax=Erinaceus europaeus TaxID=9365 RepID=A0ABM3XSB2_ERIEU|nr:SS18-like protein 2 [Erinaceus europaeus]